MKNTETPNSQELYFRSVLKLDSQRTESEIKDRLSKYEKLRVNDEFGLTYLFFRSFCFDRLSPQTLTHLDNYLQIITDIARYKREQWNGIVSTTDFMLDHIDKKASTYFRSTGSAFPYVYFQLDPLSNNTANLLMKLKCERVAEEYSAKNPSWFITSFVNPDTHQVGVWISPHKIPFSFDLLDR